MPQHTFYQSSTINQRQYVAVTSDKHNLYTDGFTGDGQVTIFVMAADDGATWNILYIFPQSSAERSVRQIPTTSPLSARLTTINIR